MKKLLYKIKCYLNKHKKLKLILHIFRYIVRFSSYVITLLFVLGLLLSCNKQDHNNKVLPKVYDNNIIQPIKCMNKTSDRLYISVQEVCSASYYNQLIACLNVYCDDLNSNTWQTPLYCDLNCVYSYDFSNILSASTNSFAVRKNNNDLYIMFYEWVSSSNWHVVGSYFTLNANDIYSEYSVNGYYTGSGNIYDIPLNFFDRTDIVQKSYSFYVPYWDVQSLGLVNPLYEYLAEDKQVTSEINDAYNRGISEGYEQGERTGYNNGYLQGLEDGEDGTLSQPFNVIKSAFDALGSFLNIQILPHLTVGTLVFTPMILSLIIVVVKMIRG